MANPSIYDGTPIPISGSTPFGYYDLDYFLILIPIFALSWYVQHMLKSKFKKFSKQPLSANLTGKEVAEKMLNDHEFIYTSSNKTKNI